MNLANFKPINIIKTIHRDAWKKQAIERFSSDFSKSKPNNRGKVNTQT